jgi:hypothetical protein
MILERQNIVNIDKLQQQLEQVGDVPNVAELTGFVDYYQLCHQAVNEVSAKLAVARHAIPASIRHIISA